MLDIKKKAEKPSIFFRKFNKTYQLLIEKYLRYSDLLKLQHTAIDCEDLEKIERYKSLEEIYSHEIYITEKTYAALEQDIIKNNITCDIVSCHKNIELQRERVLELSQENQVLLDKKLFKIESLLRKQIKNKYAVRSFQTGSSPEIIDIEA